MITAAIEKRLASLEFAAKHGKRGKRSYVEDMREWLQSIDGQAEIGTIQGEGLYWEMVRRLQVAPGYDLSLMPGDTLQEKHKNVEVAYHDNIVVTPEAKQAASKWFGLWEGL
jgi:hypothetical protein